ncbi:MAG: DNA double-strand break repair nuclease NurA [Thermoplasmatales archaeon]|nr:DNA double-strand break repair nuclease NurA [Thermoplasmatales archaeon]
MSTGFYDYVEFLRKNREQIKGDLMIPKDSWRRSLYSEIFDKYFFPMPNYSEPHGMISATDSSEIIRELYNGKKLMLFRSLTSIQNKNYESFLTKLQVVAREDVQRYTIMSMEHSEHLSILKMLENESPDYILVDGSLSGRIFSEEIAIDADDFKEFRNEYFTSLLTMVDLAVRKNIPLIFIAKSSDSSIFRNFLLSQVQAEGKKIDLERKSRSTDHFIIKSMATYPGYSFPVSHTMKLATGDRQMEIPIITTHILPDTRDLPFKVEIVASKNDGNEDLREDIRSLLFWGYGGLKVHNIWLSRVDDLVKFRSEETENVFMRAFEKEIGISLYETRGERRARIRI